VGTMSSALTNFLYHYSYFAIFLLSFISSMGIPAGSELAIIGGGALASGHVHKLLSDGQQSPEFFHLSLALVIVVAILGEVLGSLVGYLIGAKGGRVAVDKWGKYLLLTHKDLDRAEAWFDRHGEPLVLFGRFIPLLRSFVSFAAGLAEMAFAKFLVFTVIGCAVWCTALSLLGYSLGGTYDHVQKSFSYATYVIAVLAVVAVAVLIWHRIRTVRQERAQEGQR
jgi:membrane protein DedA with SNARE-associated domain